MTLLDIVDIIGILAAMVMFEFSPSPVGRLLCLVAISLFLLSLVL